MATYFNGELVDSAPSTEPLTLEQRHLRATALYLDLRIHYTYSCTDEAARAIAHQQTIINDLELQLHYRDQGLE